jgi:hypothetical protein
MAFCSVVVSMRACVDVCVRECACEAHTHFTMGTHHPPTHPHPPTPPLALTCVAMLRLRSDLGNFAISRARISIAIPEP